jgi:hypothetical protein
VERAQAFKERMSFPLMSPAMGRQREMPEEPEQTQKAPESLKSPDSTSFLKSPEARKFVENWAPKFTKRGLNDLLTELHSNESITSDKDVIKTAQRILMKLGNEDGLQSFLGKLKAKPEGIIKTIGKLFGGGK